MIFGEFSFETEKGYFNKMSVNIQNLNNDELKIFITRFSKYSGDYVRNILSLLNNANETQYEIITNGLKSCMKDVNNRILFQLYDRILNLLEKENLKNIVKKQEISEEKSKNFFNIRNIFRNAINKEEKLEKKEIENIEQDENVKVVENVNIKELPEGKAIDLTNQNVKVVGGRWSQKVIEKAEKYAKEKGFKIEFIHATSVFRNSDKLKNSDIIIFDTSYNSHSTYYKLKSYGLKIYRISTSNLDRIKNLSK